MSATAGNAITRRRWVWGWARLGKARRSRCGFKSVWRSPRLVRGSDSRHTKMHTKMLESKKQEQGFTLVEVLVAILIATLFVTVTMNMMVGAAYMKARAQQYSAAINRIQQDLEQVKYQAAQLSFPTLTAAASGTTLSVSSSTFLSTTNGNNQIQVGTDSKTYTVSSINGLSVTLSTSLRSTQPIGSKVINSSYCQTNNTGIPDTLKSNNNMPTSVGTIPYAVKINDTTTVPDFNSITNSADNRNPIQVGGTKLWILRKATSSDKLLQLYYAVVQDVNNSPGSFSVGTLYTEVLPNAAFQCP